MPVHKARAAGGGRARSRNGRAVSDGRAGGEGRRWRAVAAFRLLPGKQGPSSFFWGTAGQEAGGQEHPISGRRREDK